MEDETVEDSGMTDRSSAEAAGEALCKFRLLCATHQPLIRNLG
jgi:hypothetical protein